MAEVIPIKLYTTESTYVGIGNKPTQKPYKRVVGMSIGDGMPSELWTPEYNRFSREGYSRADVDEVKIDATEMFALSLSSFYDRFFVEGPNRPAQPEIPGQKQDYEPSRYLTNCHRFGYWMRGSVVAQGDPLPTAPDYVVQKGFKAHPNFPLGKHAVLGSGAAAHSVVGMGRDVDTCIQVLATGGNLGIDTYQNTLDYYDKDQSKGYAYFV